MNTVEVVLVQLKTIRTGTRSFGRIGRELRRWQADMRASPIERKTMIVSIWLAIRMIHVNHHGNLQHKNQL